MLNLFLEHEMDCVIWWQITSPCSQRRCGWESLSPGIPKTLEKDPFWSRRRSSFALPLPCDLCVLPGIGSMHSFQQGPWGWTDSDNPRRYSLWGTPWCFSLEIIESFQQKGSCSIYLNSLSSFVLIHHFSLSTWKCLKVQNEPPTQPGLHFKRVTAFFVHVQLT